MKFHGDAEVERYRYLSSRAPDPDLEAIVVRWFRDSQLGQVARSGKSTSLAAVAAMPK
jgi:hypothetical protein